MSLPKGVSVGFKTVATSELFEQPLVVDNSVMMRWLFRDGSEKDQQYAQRVLDRLKTDGKQVIAPYLWVYEAAFVVHFYVRKHDISARTGQEHLEALFDLCTVIRGEETPASLLAFANDHAQSAYDASYLMLAKQRGCPIATLDKKMLAAARRLELDVFVA